MLTDSDIQRLRELGKSEEEIHAILVEDLALDESIQKAAYQEWVGILVRMWDAVDKDVDDRRLALYAEEFTNIPLGLLEKAVGRAIRANGKYLSVPSVGAIWDAIRKETGEHSNMDVLETVQLWKEQANDQFERNIYRFEPVVARSVAIETEMA